MPTKNVSRHFSFLGEIHHLSGPSHPFCCLGTLSALVLARGTVMTGQHIRENVRAMLCVW